MAEIKKRVSRDQRTGEMLTDLAFITLASFFIVTTYLPPAIRHRHHKRRFTNTFFRTGRKAQKEPPQNGKSPVLRRFLLWIILLLSLRPKFLLLHRSLWQDRSMDVEPTASL
ncbi:MAG TPA: hypothetical protein VFF80_07740 [Bacillota bacterium]|nr:hypothetical protein [Bacillota bacterium]